ncbi:MAG: hypothetical protein JWP65_878, partial [Ramlibacter sp.]|nr:hypothetical protein [Ramlibacter sp.]
MNAAAAPGSVWRRVQVPAREPAPVLAQVPGGIRAPARERAQAARLVRERVAHLAPEPAV